MDTELTEVVEFLAGHAPFDALEPAKLRALARSLQMRYYRRGSAFLRLGQPNNSLFILRSGAADVVGAQGDLVERTEPGGSFGATSLLVKSPSRYEITAIEDSLALVMAGDEFRRLHDAEPAFGEFYARNSAARMRRAAQSLLPGDTSILRLGVEDLIGRAPVTASPTTTIRECARLMSNERVSALLITDDDQLVGILTDRDLRTRVIVAGVDTDLPVADVMTRHPLTIDPRARAFDVLLQMTRHRVHHVPVVAGSRPVGMVSAGDIMRLETSNPVFLAGDVWRQNDVAGIVTVTERAPRLVEQLVAGGASAHDVAHALTAVMDAVTTRLIRLATDELGPAPRPWCWLALGSQGRREQALGSDQDHAIIVDDGTTDEELNWYEALAFRVRAGLEAAGAVPCPGDVMATNPRWRVRAAQWRRYFSGWVNEPDPMAVMHSQIFFDARPVDGETRLFDTLQAGVLEATRNSPRFLGNLAATAVARRPPLGFFRNFVLEPHGEHRDTVDMKAGGLHAIIELVRVHALAVGLRDVGTLERLRALPGTGRLSAESASELADAFEFIGHVRLRHQAAQVRQGRPADNHVAPRTLSAIDQRHLKDAFAVVREAQSGLALTYQTHLMS